MPFGFLRRRRPPGHLVVDEPTERLTIEGGTVLVRGWALGGDDNGQVTVTAGGHELDVLRHPRPDVAEAHALADPTLAVGFAAVGDRRDLPATGEIVVEAVFRRQRIRRADVAEFVNEPGEPVPVEPVERCPICRATDRTVVGSSDGLRMARCAGCEVVYTVDRPESGFLAARYSADYFTTEYLPALEAELTEMGRHWARLLDHLEPHRRGEARLFEIGCGAGRFLEAARERGWVVAGGDINAAAVEHGQRTLGLDLTCRAADQPVGDGGPYDAVVSEMSLEHVPDPAAVMAAIATGLGEGGVVLVFTVSSEGRSFTELGMASPLVGPAEHLFLFSAHSLRVLAERAGLTVIDEWCDESGDAIGMLARKAGGVGSNVGVSETPPRPVAP